MVKMVLDIDTKNRINACRDILVGKVPDPKSQIEQITIALIYKFMDDIDKKRKNENKKPIYLRNGFEKYNWDNLMSNKLSSDEFFNLYVEAIESFQEKGKKENKKILPHIFNRIFKDYYIPYRDARTLKLFLKEISYFDYTHSEKLGDAFEYLLSVMSSQGDAGQFRTPRHIIKFIVDCVKPKENESVLDPACGTCGFLIEAFNFLKEKNMDFLSKNYVGYDIAPEMVKLGVVNMYFHKFVNPKIFEYDTLTDDKFWNKTFDIILTNPPFMTPKGGIKPNDRFDIQATRSEVLFLEYLHEHLKKEGRAGVIIPEGIIFQNGNAYKQIRKMLVENSLFCVVSLPAGVFKPYSGVKTSILILDRERAGQTDEILFIKIENDGLDLGAQRREIDKNDLPEALEIINDWKQGKKRKSEIALWVKKEKISEDGYYDLTGDRYRETESFKNVKYPMVELAKVMETITPPKKIKKRDFKNNGAYPIIDQSQEKIAGWSDDEKALVKSNKPLIVFGDHTCAMKFIEGPFVQGADGIKIIKVCDDIVPKFLFHILKNRLIKPEGYKRHFTKLKNLKVPLPPLEIQNQIVEEIEVKQNAINHAKEIIKNLERERQYFGEEVKKIENIEMVELGEVLDYEQPTNYIVNSVNYNDEYKTLVLTAGKSFILGKTNETEGIFPNENLPVIIFDDFTTAIKFVDFPFKVKSSAMKILKIKDKNKADIKFIFSVMRNIKFDASTHKRYWISEFSKLKIPLPSLKIQQQLVAEAEKEEEIIKANKKLIEIMEKKIKKVISEI